MLSRHNVFGFEPSFVLAIVAGAIHTLLAIVITALNLRYKTRYMMVVSIAATADLIGYFIRANSAKHPDVLGSRIAMELFVLLSPLVLALGSYLTVAKLIRYSDAKFKYFTPAFVEKFFVILDGISFMIQGAGGGLTASMKTANIGKIVVVIGLVIALASLLVFTWVTTTMMLDKKLRLRFAGPNAEYNESRWRIIYIPIYINIVMLVARSIYRLVEFLGGYDGYVSTHEEYFYGFDTLLIIIGYLSFIVIHPGRLKLFNNVVDEKAALTMNEM